jgi:Tfp pilus assembly protein PilF
VALDPHNAYYRLLLAQEQVAVGKMREAQKNVDAALASDADTVFTYFLSQKMPVPSLHSVLVSGLEKLIKQNPKKPDAYGYLADWYRYNNHLDLAIDVAEHGYTNTQALYLLKIKERCEYLKKKGLSGP